jgi:hypothetical protein
MNRKKLSLGIDNFEKLRTDDFYYVDKTLLIRDLLNGWGEVNLFTRPLRFGKSLNMSMLKAFFAVNSNKFLFDGLAISEEQELCDKYMGRFPVVSLSLKSVEGLSFKAAYERVRSLIREEASQFEFLRDSDKITDADKSAFLHILRGEDTQSDIIDALKLFTRILAKHYGKKTIVLIDEYDVPLDKAYNGNYYNEMLSLIRSMFGQALKTNDYLQFAVLTGCLRISKESIFTGLNNLKVYSVADENFDEYFGFTEDEVEQMLEYYGLKEYRAEMKEWYDGYRFGQQDVYCPWDVINYCHDLITTKNARVKSYWINTSGNDMVRNLIDRSTTGAEKLEIERLIAGEVISKMINDKLTYNEIALDINNIWSVLFMTGYLTMAGEPDGDFYKLVIPNKEVRQIYTSQVLKWFKEKAAAETNTLSALYAAFASGDTEKIKEILDEQLLYTISFHDAYESFYHGFLLALLNTCADWRVTSNRETGKGRSDILVESVDGKLGIVIEVKDVKGGKLEETCKAAIKQIEDKDYAAVLRRYRVKNIWEYGIAFCGKECCVTARHLS